MSLVLDPLSTCDDHMPHGPTPSMRGESSLDDASAHLRMLPLEQLLADDRLVARWCDLLGRSDNAYAVLHPHHVAHEWRFWAGKSHDSRWQPQVLILKSGDEWQGLAVLLPKPLSIQRLTHLPFPGTLTGWHLVGGQILRARGRTPPAEDPSGRCRRMFAAMRAHVRQSGGAFLQIEDLDVDAPLYGAVQSQSGPEFEVVVPYEYRSRWRIELTGGAAAYWSKYSSKTRNGFKRKQKKCGSRLLECITDPRDVPRFLEVASEISKHTWQSHELGLRIRNDERDLALYTAQAEAGMFRSYLWSLDGRPVAFLVGNQAGETFHYEEVGFHEDFGDYSPGLLLLIDVLDEMLLVNTPRWFDFGGGDAEYKRIFGTEESRSGTTWVVPRGGVSSALFRTACVMNGIRRQGARLRNVHARWKREQALKLRKADTAGGKPPTPDQNPS